MEQGNFRELNELKVILPYQTENFEENETLLFFDKILLANFNELKSFKAARGGKDNQAKVMWDKTSEIALNFYQGIFSKEQFSILSNSKIKKENTSPMIISTREYVETDENLNITLKNAPIGKVYVYDIKGNKYNFDNFKITDGEPFTNYIVDYFYNYNKNSYTVQIGNRLLNGFVRIEAKTKFKDDYDGKLRTVLLVFPKVRIYSNINLNFGENAPFNLAQMSATAYKGERDFMEIIFLDEDISSDIKE